MVAYSSDREPQNANTESAQRDHARHDGHAMAVETRRAQFRQEREESRRDCGMRRAAAPQDGHRPGMWQMLRCSLRRMRRTYHRRQLPGTRSAGGYRGTERPSTARAIRRDQAIAALDQRGDFLPVGAGVEPDAESEFGFRNRRHEKTSAGSATDQHGHGRTDGCLAQTATRSP